MIGVIVNPRSGFVKAHGVDGVRAMILDAIPAAEIHLLRQGDDVASLCREFLAAGATCVAAAGGDGTVRSVAAQLVDTDTPLGVIPGGTFNHFARDVGVGRDVSEALQVLARGYSLPVDVASVNGRIFLNNSSIGLYPAMVAVRTRYEEKMSRWRAMIQAALLVLRHAPLISVDISDGEDTIHVTTRLLFVGNNQYELNLLSLGRRERLDAGELWCIILDDSSRVRIIPNMLAFLQGNQPNERFFRVQSTTELKVIPRGTRRQIEVSADGEAFRVPIPLVYRVKPRSLKVIVPRPPPPESREARSVNSEEEPSSQAP